LSTTLPSWQENKVKSSLSISPCHYHDFPLSAAYTKCSIHQVQHRLKIVWCPFILTISNQPLNAALASGMPPYWATATSQCQNQNIIWIYRWSCWVISWQPAEFRLELILSINDISFFPICLMPLKYVWWIRSTISVAAN
jgi:hypothetical protein